MAVALKRCVSVVKERGSVLMTATELDQFERRWKRVFSVAACVLVLCILDIALFFSEWPSRTGAYAVGAVSVSIGLYAAKKLRDLERGRAVVDGAWLNRAENEGGEADGDDD